MGAGYWRNDTYDRTYGARLSQGQSGFTYSDSVRALPRDQRKAHPDLEPKGVAFRECCDTTEHPLSTPIIVAFDVTGSMRTVPMRLQALLPDLHKLLQDAGAVTDPEILFAAFGDATSDAVPVQVGQFESDNRMDDQLGSIYLEGNGGSQQTESYELMLYWVARHTKIDSFDKRGEKGFLFMFGDEMPYSEVKQSEVNRFIDENFQGNISFRDILEEVRQRYHVFFITPSHTTNYNNERITKFWSDTMGANYLRLEEIDKVCDMISDEITKVNAIANLKSMANLRPGP